MKNVDIEKCIFEKEMRKKTKEYQIFVFKDIFSEYELKEYTNGGIEKMMQKIVKTKASSARTLYGMKEICGFAHMKNDTRIQNFLR